MLLQVKVPRGIRTMPRCGPTSPRWTLY